MARLRVALIRLTAQRWVVLLVVAYLVVEPVATVVGVATKG